MGSSPIVSTDRRQAAPTGGGSRDPVVRLGASEPCLERAESSTTGREPRSPGCGGCPGVEVPGGAGVGVGGEDDRPVGGRGRAFVLDELLERERDQRNIRRFEIEPDHRPVGRSSGAPKSDRSPRTGNSIPGRGPTIKSGRPLKAVGHARHVGGVAKRGAPRPGHRRGPAPPSRRPRRGRSGCR